MTTCVSRVWQPALSAGSGLHIERKEVARKRPWQQQSSTVKVRCSLSEQRRQLSHRVVTIPLGQLTKLPGDASRLVVEYDARGALTPEEMGRRYEETKDQFNLYSEKEWAAIIEGLPSDAQDAAWDEVRRAQARLKEQGTQKGESEAKGP